MDIVEQLQAAAPRTAERLWESPTRFWSILAFSRGWPDWSGRDFPFTAELPRGGRTRGAVSLSNRAGWVRFRDLPPGAVPVYLVLGRGAGPGSGCLRYEELTQVHGSHLQLIDLRRSDASAYRIAPLDPARAGLLVDARHRWLLEMDQLALVPAARRRF